MRLNFFIRSIMSEVMERQRVVITGIGTVTSYGDGIEALWTISSLVKVALIRLNHLIPPIIHPKLARSAYTLMRLNTWIQKKRAVTTDTRSLLWLLPDLR